VGPTIGTCLFGFKMNPGRFNGEYDDDEAIRQALYLSQSDQVVSDEQVINQAIERSLSDNGIEKATNLALELSQNEQVVRDAMLLSEREQRIQQEQAEFDNMVEKAQVISLETLQSEEESANEEWINAQKVAQEESRRAYIEEQDRLNRLWEHSLLGEPARYMDSLQQESGRLYNELDEGYSSATSQSESTTPKLPSPLPIIPTAQPPPTVSQRTWQFPTEQTWPPALTHNSEPRGSSSLGRNTSHAGSTATNQTHRSTQTDSISGDIVRFLPTHQKGTKVRQIPLRLSLTAHCENGPAPEERGTFAVPLAPQAVTNEYHWEGDVYYQTTNNYYENGTKKTTHRNTAQSFDPRQTSAGVHGLYSKSETDRSLHHTPSTGRSKHGLSFLKNVSNRVLGRPESALPGKDGDYRAGDKVSHSRHLPPTSIVESSGSASWHPSGSKTGVHPATWGQQPDTRLPGQVQRAELPGAWPYSTAPEGLGEILRSRVRSRNQEAEHGAALHNEPLYAPITPPVAIQEAYHTVIPSRLSDTMSDDGLSFYTAPTSHMSPAHPTPVDDRARITPNALVERLKHEAIRTPIVPGAYPESTISSTPVSPPSPPHERPSAAFYTPVVSDKPSRPPKIPLPKIPTPYQPHLPESQAPGAFPPTSPPPRISTEPETLFQSTLPRSFPVPRPTPSTSLVSDVSMAVHSPTPERLRADIGRSFAYRPLNPNWPLVPGPEQALSNIGNHAMRDLDRHGGGGGMPTTAPILPMLPSDYGRRPHKEERGYESEEAKAKRLEKERVKMARTALR
jgi:hypothetical protein